MIRVRRIPRERACSHIAWHTPERHPRRSRDERGLSPAVEASLLFPGLALLIALIIFGGRLELSRQAVQSAAAEAARAASISRTAAEAAARARTAAAASLSAEQLRCVSSDVSVDTSQMSKPAGSGGSVSVRLTCVVSMSDISLPGVPGSVSLSAVQNSVIDTYRER